MIKTLYVTDLDGTLLDPEGFLSTESATLLRDAMDSGALVSFATSRSWKAAQEALRGFVFNAPCIAGGGVVIGDPSDGHVVRELFLERPVAVEIIHAFRRAGAMPFTKSRDKDDVEHVYHSRLTHPGQRQYFERRSAGNMARFRQVEDYGDFHDEKPVIVFSVDEKAMILKAADELSRLRAAGLAFEHINFHDPYTGFEWLEALPDGADKGSAALYVKQLVGSDRLVCFGDGGNDIPMFQAADHAVAVANAADELLPFAHECLKTREDDSVAHYIRAHSAMH